MGSCHSKKIEKPTGASGISKKNNNSEDDSVNIETRDVMGSAGNAPRKMNNNNKGGESVVSLSPKAVSN